MTEPALTPEQWREAVRDRGRFAVAMQRAWGEYLRPFGFTWEDVDLLERAARNAAPLADYSGEESIAEMAATYRALAGRIAALLPPRGP